MKKGFLALILIFFYSLNRGYAQVADSTRDKVQQELENGLESFDPNNPNLNTEQLTQMLLDLAAHPLDINEAPIDKLMIIPGVNLKIARAIVRYRKKVKPFENIDELKYVKGIGSVTLERMRPYVTIGSGLELGKNLYGNYHYWLSGGHFDTYTRYRETLQRKAGFRKPDSSGGFLGNRMQFYQRLQYQSRHFSLNLTQQKDAGEPFAGPMGFDFSSWHVSLQNNGNLRELVVGDYGLYFGQGLVFWNGRTFGKGRDVIGSGDRSARGVDPYSSSAEAGFYRGVAATYGRKLQVTGFYSSRRETATVVSAGVRRMPKTNGYHRTLKEQNERNDLGQKVYGGHLKIKFPFGFVGISGYQTSFDKLIARGTLLSSKYDFSGRKNAVIGANYNIVAGPAILFGEAARSKNGGLGLISGIESPLGTGTKITIVYRNYAKNFQSFMGNGFGEQSGPPKNERGLYIGLRHSINNRITLSAYYDQYHFPAPRYLTVQPTQGHDWLGLLQVKFSRKLSFYAQVRNEIKGDNFQTPDQFGRMQNRLGESLRGSIRGQLQYQVNNKIRLRTRFEAVRSRRAGAKMEHGYLIYQDLQFAPNQKLTIDSRVTVFNTDSYNTRLYQFENGLLYVLSDKVLFNQGERTYAVVKYKPFSHLEIWTKFGITTFENQQTISSGLNEIQGNHRSHFGIEVRLEY